MSSQPDALARASTCAFPQIILTGGCDTFAGDTSGKFGGPEACRLRSRRQDKGTGGPKLLGPVSSSLDKTLAAGCGAGNLHAEKAQYVII